MLAKNESPKNPISEEKQLTMTDQKRDCYSSLPSMAARNHIHSKKEEFGEIIEIDGNRCTKHKKLQWTASDE